MSSILVSEIEVAREPSAVLDFPFSNASVRAKILVAEAPT